MIGETGYRDALEESQGQAASSRRITVRRHSLLVRVTHWINLLCMTILLMSGLQIFNAHPALYWGAQSDWNHPLLALWAMRGPDGQPVGLTTILGHSFHTTGVLGLELVDSFADIGGGRGGYWEDRGYEWYAGI